MYSSTQRSELELNALFDNFTVEKILPTQILVETKEQTSDNKK